MAKQPTSKNDNNAKEEQVEFPLENTPLKNKAFLLSP
jgi:hypothetical protein